jgi:ankyrin repeat protein
MFNYHFDKPTMRYYLEWKSTLELEAKWLENSEADVKNGEKPLLSPDAYPDLSQQDIHTLGVSPNAADKDGTTPIFLAAFHNQAESIKALIALGATNQRRKGITPWEIAYRNGNFEAMSVLNSLGYAPRASLRTSKSDPSIGSGLATPPKSSVQLSSSSSGQNPPLEDPSSKKQKRNSQPSLSSLPFLSSLRQSLSLLRSSTDSDQSETDDQSSRLRFKLGS